MKKFLILLIMLVAVTSLSAYTIETSRGEIELAVPEGFTLEEAYCEMAKLYLEERWDHEKLLESSKELTEEVDKYVLENKKLRNDYDKLNDSYKELSLLYERKTRVPMLQPYLGVNVGTSTDSILTSFGVDAGAIVLDKFLVYSSIEYPYFNIRLGIDFKL